MKAQTKAILASVVVIALALSAVSGITYSWFSDTESTEIKVTAATVDVDLEIKTLGTNDVSSVTSGTYSFGFSNDANAVYDASGTEPATIELNNMADEDSIKIGFQATNKSTVQIQWRIVAAISGPLASYLTTVFDDNQNSWATADAVASKDTPEELSNGSVTFTLKSNGAANAANATPSEPTVITLTIEAYQSNANLPSSTSTVTVSSGGTVSQTLTTDDSTGAVTGASVTFKSSSVSTSDVSYTVATTSTSTTTGTYYVSGGGSIIAGISVTSNDSSINTQKAVVSFTIDNSLVVDGTPSTLNGAYSIVHSSSSGDAALNLVPSSAMVTADNDEGTYYISDNGDGTYTIYVAVEGFSSYLVVAANAAITKNGETSYYSTVADAFAAAEKGGEMAGTSESPAVITLLRSCEGKGIQVGSGSYIDFDLNGHSYTIAGDESLTGSEKTRTQGFQLLKDSFITFENGTVKVSSTATSPDSGQVSKIVIQNYTNLTLKNMVIDGSELKDDGGAYALSNNNGTVEVIDSKIIALSGNKTGNYAMDCYANFGSYEGPHITVSGKSVLGPVVVWMDTEDKLTGTTQFLTIESGVTYSSIYIHSVFSDADIEIAADAYDEDKIIVKEGVGFSFKLNEARTYYVLTETTSA